MVDRLDQLLDRTPPRQDEDPAGSGTVELREPAVSPTPVTDAGLPEPRGNESRETWAEFARQQGAPERELADPADGGLTRNQIRAKYGTAD